jgi:Endonuclease related to archaeal Holliday junction resolvase
MLGAMLALVIVLGVVLTVVIALLVLRERSFAAYRERYKHTPKDLADAREHSVATSKGSTRGQAAEHLAPYLPGLTETFAPGDWRFLGSPVDFVVFDGLCNEGVERVVFVEVKSGRPTLAPRQVQLRSAITSGALPLEWLTVEIPRRTERQMRALRPRLTKLPPGAVDGELATDRPRSRRKSARPALAEERQQDHTNGDGDEGR